MERPVKPNVHQMHWWLQNCDQRQQLMVEEAAQAKMWKMQEQMRHRQTVHTDVIWKDGNNASLKEGVRNKGRQCDGSIG